MTILKMNFLASILIFVITFIRITMLQWLPKKTFPVLWSVVLYRLLVPFFVSSKFSVYTLINVLKNRLINTTTFLELEFSIDRNAVSDIASNITSTVPLTNVADMNILLIRVLWIIGICVCALFFLISHFRCLMEYKTSLPVENALIEKWKQEHFIKRRVDIRQSDKVTTALTYGLFRPVVLLPKTIDWTDETQLQYILTHEYAHIKELDILLKWFLAISVCVHWFNPFVWIMYILANRDIELSCDETVVWTLGETVRYSYALTLIELEEKKSSFTPFANRFSKNPIEERMVLIMKTRRVSFIGILSAFAIIISTSIAFTTDSVSEASGTVRFTSQDTTPEGIETPNNFMETRTANCSVDFVKSEEVINLKNGTASEHDAENGKMILYKDQNETWSLKQGETICIDVNIEDVFKDGQTAVIGYVIDNSYTDIFSGKITHNESVEFVAPKEGNYAFYFIGASSDTIYIHSLSIS